MGRDTIIGAVAAVLFLGALLYVGFGIPPNPPSVYADVNSGFVGIKTYGAWRLVCAKPSAADEAAKSGGIPLSLGGTPPAAQASPFRRCLTLLLVPRRDNPRAVVLAISFRNAKAGTKTALIVHFPVLGKQGDTLGFQVDTKGALKLPVRQCGQNGCIAAGYLSNDVRNLIAAGQRGVVLFPTKKDGKPLYVIINLTGLKDSLGAMERAES